jgi:hypothetical protein
MHLLAHLPFLHSKMVVPPVFHGGIQSSTLLGNGLNRVQLYIMSMGMMGSTELQLSGLVIITRPILHTVANYLWQSADGESVRVRGSAAWADSACAKFRSALDFQQLSLHGLSFTFQTC